MVIGILIPVGVVKIDNSIQLFDVSHFGINIVGDLLQTHRVVAIVLLPGALGDVSKDPFLITGTNLR